MVLAKEEVWADADGNPVPFNDPRGKSVLVGKGTMISPADAEKYAALSSTDLNRKTEQEAEPVAVPPLLPVDSPAVTKKATK